MTEVVCIASNFNIIIESLQNRYDSFHSLCCTPSYSIKNNPETLSTRSTQDKLWVSFNTWDECSTSTAKIVLLNMWTKPVTLTLLSIGPSWRPLSSFFPYWGWPGCLGSWPLIATPLCLHGCSPSSTPSRFVHNVWIMHLWQGWSLLLNYEAS